MKRAIPRFLRGIIVPMLTPCREDGSLHDEGIRALIRHFKSLGFISGVFVRSGVGQMYTFTVAEIKHMIDVAVQEAAGEIPILAGAAGEYDGNPAHRPEPKRYVEQTIELVSYAAEKGCPAAVIVLPSALRREKERPLSETAYNYFARVSEKAEIPLVAYQPPAFSQRYRMTPSLLRKIVGLKMVRAMKYSVTERKQFAAMAEVVRGTDFALICGIEEFYLEALSFGAVGVIAGGCNTHPEIIYAIQRAHHDGNQKAAAAAQEALLKAIRAFGRLDWPTAAIAYLSRKIPGINPFARTEARCYDPKIIDPLERALDEVIAPYRTQTKEP